MCVLGDKEMGGQRLMWSGFSRSPPIPSLLRPYLGLGPTSDNKEAEIQVEW